MSRGDEIREHNKRFWEADTAYLLELLDAERTENQRLQDFIQRAMADIDIGCLGTARAKLWQALQPKEDVK
jgi:hypothetical protein